MKLPFILFLILKNFGTRTVAFKRNKLEETSVIIALTVLFNIDEINDSLKTYEDMRNPFIKLKELLEKNTVMIDCNEGLFNSNNHGFNTLFKKHDIFKSLRKYVNHKDLTWSFLKILSNIKLAPNIKEEGSEITNLNQLFQAKIINRKNNLESYSSSTICILPLPCSKRCDHCNYKNLIDEFYTIFERAVSIPSNSSSLYDFIAPLYIIVSVLADNKRIIFENELDLKNDRYELIILVCFSRKVETDYNIFIKNKDHFIVIDSDGYKTEKNICTEMKHSMAVYKKL